MLAINGSLTSSFFSDGVLTETEPFSLEGLRSVKLDCPGTPGGVDFPSTSRFPVFF